MRGLVSIAVLSLFTAGSAWAGGFSLREQSTEGLGSAFAGIAAGGHSPSSMFWNPATMTQHADQGLLSESDISLIAPYSRAKDGGPAPGTPAPGLSDSGNVGTVAFLPSSYYLYGVNDKFVIGASLNSPYGLETDSDNWFGSPHGDRSRVRTYTVTPSAAYNLGNGFSVGVGLQAEYMSVDLSSKTPAGVKFFDADGDDFGFGFTAGLLFEPSEWTSIGLGFRSSVSHKLKGDANILTALGAINPDIEADFKSPETVTLGIRQKVNDRFTLLAGAEWANWSRFKELRVEQRGTGATLGVTEENWKDSWFVSLGGEYKFDDKLTLRAGAAYEKSPVPDSTRTPRIPDNDRIWLSLGASYDLNDRNRLSLGYSHIFVDKGKVNLAGGGGLPPLSANFKQHIDIVSASFTHDW